MSTLKVNAIVDASGGNTATINTYSPPAPVRAWVNFDGTTSPITIRASYNVTNITDNGTGDYTINFTNAMPDANYAIVCLNTQGAGNAAVNICKNTSRTDTTGVVNIVSVQGSTRLDFSIIHLAIFR